MPVTLTTIPLADLHTDHTATPETCTLGLVMGITGLQFGPPALMVVTNPQLVQEHLNEIKFINSRLIVTAPSNHELQQFGVELITQQNIPAEELPVWQATVERIQTDFEARQSRRKETK